MGVEEWLFRSYLYVPGTDEHRIAKALDGEADAVVIDLEDAVAPERKEEARRVAAEVVAGALPKPVFVRINSMGSGLAGADLEALQGPGLAGIRVPKTETPGQVAEVSRTMGTDRQVMIVPLIESALGVERAGEIAAAEGVTALAMGEADLRADLGVTVDDGLLYARSRCVTAARAAGHAAIQSVFADLRDSDALAVSTRWGRQMGFIGRSAIHPSQVPVINDVLTPTDDEVRRAEEIIDAYERSRSGGLGTAVTPGGKFVDEAVVRAARSLLRLAGRSHPGS